MRTFSKKVHALYNGIGVWTKAPEAGEFSKIFVLKVILQSVRLYF